MENRALYSREIAAGIPIETLRGIRCFQGGAGNTGSHFTERAIHNFLVNAFIVDYDREGYQEHNFAHSSFLLNPAEDLGKPKAETLAARASEKLLTRGSILGKTMDIRDIGPGILRHFDLALGLFDNAEARKHLYRISREAGVPFLEIGIDATGGQLQFFDHSPDASCYFCSLQDQVMEQSCEVKYENDLANGIAPNTDILGGLMADLAVQAVMSYFGKTGSFERNARYCFHAQDFTLEKRVFPKKKNCEGCGSTYEANVPVSELEGSVADVSFSDLERQVKTACGEGAEIYLPDEFCVKEVCPVCGREKRFNKPSRRISYSDVICPGCRAAYDGEALGKAPGSVRLDGLCTIPEDLKQMRLVDLGFPFGGIIYARKADGAFASFTMKNDYEKLMEGTE